MLRLDNITFISTVQLSKRWWLSGWFHQYSYDFEFGKSYLLTSLHTDQNEALAYLIGGLIQPSSGNITLDGKRYSQVQRRQDSWLVRYDSIKRFGIFQQSLQKQIQLGIKNNPDLGFTEMDIMRHFDLTPARYNRLLRQFSHEGWRARCAVGFAHGRRIFCFPHMRMETIDTIQHQIAKTVAFLKSQGALVLFPQLPYVNMDGLIDEVVHTHRHQNYRIEANGTWIWKTDSDDNMRPDYK